MSSLADNIGIYGNKSIYYGLDSQHLVADTINQALVEMYTTMDGLEHSTTFNNKDMATLIETIDKTYKIIFDFTTKAIDNKTSYEFVTPEAFPKLIREELEAEGLNDAQKLTCSRIDPSLYPVYKANFNKRTSLRHEELLKLISIQKKLPAIGASIQRWKGLECKGTLSEISKKPFSDTIEVLSNTFNRLNKASEGPNSPIFNAKIEKTPEPAEHAPLPLSETSLDHLKKMDSPVSAPTVQIMVNYNVGFGKTLGICCAAINNWKTPILFSNSENEWKGNVPTGKDWKFVIIKKDGTILWEIAKNRNCQTMADGSVLNYTGQVKFS